MTTLNVNIDAVDGIVSEKSEPTPKTRIKLVQKVFNHYLNQDIDLMRHCKHKLVDGGMAPYVSEELQNTIYHDLGFLQLEEIAAHFGESTGSSNLTSVAVEAGMNVEDVIVRLAETNQLNRMRDEIRDSLQPSDDLNTMEAMAWTFVQWSLGWDAERALQSTDHFNKGGVAADSGGIDGYGNKDSVFDLGEIQVRSAVWYLNEGEDKLKAQDRQFVAYHYTCDGQIKFATSKDEIHSILDDMKEDREMNWKTNMYTTNDPNGGPDKKWRYLWG